MRFHLSFKIWGAVGALSLMAASSACLGSSAWAADLPSVKDAIAVAPAVDDFQPFFIKLGVTYALNQSSSTLYGPLAARIRGSNDFGTYPQHVGASLGNVGTLGVESGVFITRNISFDVSGGIPVWVPVTTKGYYPYNPPLANGTLLGKGQLALIPITVVYHFDKMGPVSPYLGAGVTPAFSFSNSNAFLTNIHVSGAAGLVLQGGLEWMVDRNWGFNLDAKKIFTYGSMNARGVALLPPSIPTYSQLNVRFQPLLLSFGLVYRFGGGEPLVARF
jgi:outer membrane protein